MGQACGSTAFGGPTNSRHSPRLDNQSRYTRFLSFPMNRWKIIEWDNEQDDAGSGNRSEDEYSYDSDETPPVTSSSKDRAYYKEPEPRQRLSRFSAKEEAFDAFLFRPRQTPLQRTVKELKQLWPAALLPIFLLGSRSSLLSALLPIEILLCILTAF